MFQTHAIDLFSGALTKRTYRSLTLARSEFGRIRNGKLIEVSCPTKPLAVALRGRHYTLRQPDAAPPAGPTPRGLRF